MVLEAVISLYLSDVTVTPDNLEWKTELTVKVVGNLTFVS